MRSYLNTLGETDSHVILLTSSKRGRCYQIYKSIVLCSVRKCYQSFPNGAGKSGSGEYVTRPKHFRRPNVNFEEHDSKIVATWVVCAGCALFLIYMCRLWSNRRPCLAGSVMTDPGGHEVRSIEALLSHTAKLSPPLPPAYHFVVTDCFHVLL